MAEKLYFCPLLYHTFPSSHLPITLVWSKVNGKLTVRYPSLPFPPLLYHYLEHNVRAKNAKRCLVASVDSEPHKKIF